MLKLIEDRVGKEPKVIEHEDGGGARRRSTIGSVTTSPCN